MAELDRLVIRVCATCYQSAGGVLESVEDGQPAPFARWADTAHSRWEMTPTDEGTDTDFSWHPCEGCGADAGERYLVLARLLSINPAKG